MAVQLIAQYLSPKHPRHQRRREEREAEAGARGRVVVVLIHILLSSAAYSPLRLTRYSMHWWPIVPNQVY